MRLCVIGNSHVAALKSALADAGPGSGLPDITFFASRGQALSGLEVENGCLVPARARLAKNLAFTSGGQERIDPSEFDAFILCGMGLGLRYELLGAQFYSRRFACAYTRTAWRGSLCLRVHEALRGLTNKTILVCPEPFMAESAARWSRVAHLSQMPSSYLIAAFDHTAGLLEGDSEFVGQPAESIVSTIFTAARFSAGSLRLETHDGRGDSEHGSRDAWHMNAAYGALVWAALRSRLAQRGIVGPRWPGEAASTNESSLALRT